MRKLKQILQSHLIQPTSVAEFPVKGSGLSPLDSPKYGLRCYMKLLWLSISEAHTNNQAYKMNRQYEYMQGNTSKYGMMIWMMLCTIIRERVRETIDQNANTKICFEVRAPYSTSPLTPPCRISNPLSPTEGTSTEEDLLQQREYRTPLSNTTSQPRGRPVAKQ